MLYFQDILNLADVGVIEESHAHFQAEFAKDMNFLEFLRNQRDPISLARLRFYEFVSRSDVLDIPEVFSVLDGHAQRFAFESIAIFTLVTKTFIVEKRL